MVPPYPAAPAHAYTTWTYPEDRYYYGWYDQLPDQQPSDHQIKSTVVDRLRQNPHTRDHDLKVDVEQGVVVIQGEVASARSKRAAGDDAWDTPGVSDVSNQLVVTG